MLQCRGRYDGGASTVFASYDPRTKKLVEFVFYRNKKGESIMLDKVTLPERMSDLEFTCGGETYTLDNQCGTTIRIDKHSDLCFWASAPAKCK